MASAFSHAAAALALGTAFRRPGRPARFWVLGAVCAALPDVDVVAFRFGIPYEHVLGHRGITHSLAFAAVLGAAVAWVFFREDRGRLWLYFFLATASHAVLDAMTTGGLGVAFLAPFHDARYFLPRRPIAVSPIGVGRFFTARGVAVIRSELVWVWLPSAAFAAAALLLRGRDGSRPAHAGTHRVDPNRERG